MNDAAKSRKVYIHVLIAVVLFVAIRLFLDPAGALTEKGVTVLAIFVPLAYLWITVDTAWPSLAAAVLLIAFGVLDSTSVWYEFMGSNTMIQIMGASTACMALVETGAIRWLARYVLSRRWVSSRPYVFIFMFGIVSALVDCLAGPVGAALVMLALVKELREQIGATKDDGFSRVLCMTIMWMLPLGDILIPFGKVVPILGLRMMQAQGISVALLDFAKVGWIYTAVSALVSGLILRFVMRPDLSKFQNYDSESIRRDLVENPLTARQISAFVLIVFLLLIQTLTELGIPVISPFLTKLGLGTQAMLVCVLGSLIRIEHKPVIDLHVILQKVDWSVVFFLGGMFMIAGCFSSADTGIMAWLAGMLMPLTQNVSPLVLMCVGFLLAIVLTNICSNALVVVLVDSVLYMTLLSSGAGSGELIAFGILVVQAASSAFCTPSGSSASAVVFGDRESGVTIGNCLRYNLPQVAALWIISCVAFLPLFSALLG